MKKNIFIANAKTVFILLLPLIGVAILTLIARLIDIIRDRLDISDLILVSAISFITVLTVIIILYFHIVEISRKYYNETYREILENENKTPCGYFCSYYECKISTGNDGKQTEYIAEILKNHPLHLYSIEENKNINKYENAFGHYYRNGGEVWMIGYEIPINRILRNTQILKNMKLQIKYKVYYVDDPRSNEKTVKKILEIENYFKNELSLSGIKVTDAIEFRSILSLSDDNKNSVFPDYAFLLTSKSLLFVRPNKTVERGYIALSNDIDVNTPKDCYFRMPNCIRMQYFESICENDKNGGIQKNE